jgi:excisionase family DNA binding protein
VFVDPVDDARTLTISPEMVALNPSADSDWARALLSLVREAGAVGRTVDVTSREVTFSPAEVARLADVSKATVLRRIADGTIPATRRGSRYRVAASEVDRYRLFLVDRMAALVAEDLEF